MHFREERNRRRLPTFGLRPQEPIIQPWALGRRRTPIVQPDALSSPGNIAVSFWIWLGQRYSSWRSSAAKSSSPEPSSSPDAVIDNLSSAGAPNEMLGPALSEDPAYSSGNPRRSDVLEEWEARGGVLDGEALTVILRSPWPWAEVVLRPEELERGRARGIPPRLARRYLERNIAMVMFPQWEHDSSTSAASACLKPKHAGQRSWPSDEVRKRPHPETHEREAIFKKTPVARGALLDLLFYESLPFRSAEAPRGGSSVTVSLKRNQHWIATSADAP